MKDRCAVEDYAVKCCSWIEHMQTLSSRLHDLI